MSGNVVGPKSGDCGNYLSHGLKNAAKKKGRELFKENPAYKSLKMKPKANKDQMLPRGKGSDASLEMQDMGKE